VTGEVLLEDPKGQIDGILLDLGVSSHQIDTAERGFAFMQEGPLDMRMDSSSDGLTAAHICNEFDVKELQRILKVYGEEPRARKVAESIVMHRPLRSTTDLVNAVAAVIPEYARSKRLGRISSLARVFQAFRIIVNQEVSVLERALLEMAPTLLKPGGRLVVLSYHSLEDRTTKRVMRDGVLTADSRTEKRDVYGNLIGPPRPFRPVGKMQTAQEAEVELNPRARSAKLRVAERQEG
jgi:16S rRNA (cytosine1402-N4)-methyltransferase